MSEALWRGCLGQDRDLFPVICSSVSTTLLVASLSVNTCWGSTVACST